MDKKEPALDVLTETIKSRRNRTFAQVHEEILELYLTLCIDLRRGHLAKEGLYQYKLICQQIALNSFEKAVNFYLNESASRTEEARKQSKDTVQKMMGEIDDLDQLQTPERFEGPLLGNPRGFLSSLLRSLLLSFVSGEDTQDRTDRVVLTPWVRSLWEAYRNVLDLLTNNSKLEKLYHDTAQQGKKRPGTLVEILHFFLAFKFCVEYSRKTEFRKLCDNVQENIIWSFSPEFLFQLRSHLQKVIKRPGQNSINLNSPESLQMHVEARLVQLDTAITMELWQVKKNQEQNFKFPI